MVRHYYGAPLPDYLYEKYGHLNPPQGGLKSKNEDYVRFENFLAGTGNTFIGRGAPTSGTATHLLHLKALKNPIDFMRSRSNGMSTLSADRQVRYHTHREVVFQGKEFMVEKYSIKQPRLFWFWYPYRYYCGLKGFWYVVRGTSTSSVTSTEKKKI
jgi:hypothetical protein